MPTPVDELKTALTSLATAINALLDAAGHLAPPANAGVYLSAQDLNGIVKQLTDLTQAVQAVSLKLSTSPREPVPVEPVSPPPSEERQSRAQAERQEGRSDRRH